MLATASSSSRRTGNGELLNRTSNIQRSTPKAFASRRSMKKSGSTEVEALGSNIEHRTSNIQRSTLNIQRSTSNEEKRKLGTGRADNGTTDNGQQTTDNRQRTTDNGLQTTDVRVEGERRCLLRQGYGAPGKVAPTFNCQPSAINHHSPVAP
jgi:hypothetical protein